MGSASSRYGRPSILAVPVVGVTRPSRVRRVVVLPAPLGPRKPTTVPWSTSKLRSSTATMSPKRLVSPWMVMAAIGLLLRPRPACSSRPVTWALNTARRYEAGLLASSAPSRQLPVARQADTQARCQLPAGCKTPWRPAHGVRRAAAPAGPRWRRIPAPRWRTGGPPRPIPWPGGGWFPVLDAVVVVQHARLVGAGPAVTSVEPARWMVMVDQHGCSSRSTATPSLKGLWSVVDGDDRRGLLLRPAGRGAAPPGGDGLAGLVLVSSGPAAQQPGDGQGDHHRQGEPEADPADELVDMAPAGTSGIAEQDMGDRPEGGGRPGPGREGPVAQPQHAGQAGQHHPGPSGATADDQGPAAAPQQQALHRVEAGRPDPPPQAGGEQAWDPAAADPVTGRVAGHRPGDPDGQGAAQGDAALVGQDPAQEQGQLAGED